MSDNNIQININPGNSNSDENKKKESNVRDKRTTYLGIVLPSLIAGIFGITYLFMNSDTTDSQDTEVTEEICTLRRNIDEIAKKLTGLSPSYKDDETEQLILEGYVQVLNAYKNNKYLCKGGDVDKRAFMDLNDAINRYGL